VHIGDWEPYRPPGYPITDPHHNPYAPIISGTYQGAADIWRSIGSPSSARALRRAIHAAKGGA
jgi:hypothetical protein